MMLSLLLAAQLVLADAGRQTPDYEIVPSTIDTALPAGRAATLLQQHIRDITGVTLPIRATRTSGLKAIYVNGGNYEPWGESFSLTASNGDVTIAGGSRGVLYGVYELLERFGDCTFIYDIYLEGGELIAHQDVSDIPASSTFCVPDNLNVRETAAFDFREQSWGGTWSLHNQGHGINATRTRTHTYWWLNGYPWFGKGVTSEDYHFGGGHSFFTHVPPETYFATHPEYYSYHASSDKREYANGQLCLSNEDVYRITLASITNRIELNKTADFNSQAATIFNVSQMDRNGYCECDACQALEAQYGGAHSAPVILFVNRLADALKTLYPDKDYMISTLAYMYSRQPPKNLSVRDNVIVKLCSIECDNSRPMETSRYSENVAFREELLGWLPICKGIRLWNYNVDYYRFNRIFPNIPALQASLKWYRDLGVRQIMAQGPGDLIYGDFAALKMYLIPKMLWNPDIDLDATVERFCRAYYKAAAPWVLAYWKGIYEIERNRDERTCPLRSNNTSQFVGDPQDVPFLTKMIAILREGRAAVAEDSRLVERVDRLIVSAQYSRMVKMTGGEKSQSFNITSSAYPYASLTNEVQQDAQHLLELVSAYQTAPLIEGGSNYMPLQLGESAANHAVELARVEGIAEGQIPVVSRGRVRIEEKFISLNLDGYADTQIVDDSDAEDGRAMYFPASPSTWAAYFNLNRVKLPTGGIVRLRVRAKCQKDTASTANGATVGVWRIRDNNIDVDQGTIIEKAITERPALADNVYRWYDIGLWMPLDCDRLYINPYGVKNVSIDCLELVLENPGDGWIAEGPKSAGDSGTWTGTMTSANDRLVWSDDESGTLHPNRLGPCGRKSVAYFSAAFDAAISSERERAEIPAEAQAAVKLVDINGNGDPADYRFAFLTAAGWLTPKISRISPVPHWEYVFKVEMDHSQTPATVAYRLLWQGDWTGIVASGSAATAASGIRELGVMGPGAASALRVDSTRTGLVIRFKE